MVIRTIAAALTLALLACTLQAQEYAGFPGNRVRQSKPEAIPPDELYPQNRVIIRRTDLALVGAGMQISGEVVTDFEADRVPPDKPALPKGQLMGVKVNVELYYWDTVFERDIGTAQKPGTGKIKMPQIDLKKVGTLVEGQSVTVTIDQSFERFGLAKFTLPQLTKPLAPGLYRLVASVRFKTQEAKITEAVKWCSDLYGARAEVVTDPETLESTITWHPVMGDKAIHDELYDFLIGTVGTLKDETVLWIGEVYKDGNLSLIPAEKGTDRLPANYLVWSYHLNVVEQVQNYQYQLDNADEVVDKELEARLKVGLGKNATPEEIKQLEDLKKKWVKDAEEDKKRIKRDNKDLVDKYGGRTTKDEDKRFTSAFAARLAILEQVGKFHEYLSRRYWVLTDGYLQYAGWATVYKPGWNASDAVQRNDNKDTSKKRKDAKAAVENAPGGLAGKWEKLREAWKYTPPDLYTFAAVYLKAMEETDVYDAEKFTAKVGTKIELDTNKWAEYRMNFILDFYEKSNATFKQVVTTDVYAVQVWPQALSQLTSARDDVIALTYSWEYYIRKEQMKEDGEIIKESWKREAQGTKAVPLSDYFGRATSAPGTIKTRFDGSLDLIKSATNIGDFKSAYSRAIQANVETKYLPGVRPPSAPTKEEK